MNTTDVENYPGFPDGVMGPELMDNLRKQAERFGAELITDDATEVDLAGEVKVVKVGATEYRARTVVLAMGSAYRSLGVPGEDRLSGRGVSWCATCDGFFFRDQDIVVVGGGDSALEEATFLTRFARTVTLVHRRDTPARQQDHAGARVRQRQDPVRLGLRGPRGGRRGPARGRPAAQPQDRRGVARWRRPGCSSRSATTRAPSSSAARSRSTTRATSWSTAPTPPPPTCPACSRPATSSTRTYRQAITAAGTGCAAALDAERYLAATEGPVHSGAGWDTAVPSSPPDEPFDRGHGTRPIP